ncbi:MAG: hypothetical protein L6W00_21300 [Lentisphaeria bacterium]|nr:MAG: hypothetical protein L6W00_21300 [Lentisphaeria bacterium]
MEEETVESAHAYTLDEMAELCFEVEQFKLSGRSRLDRYTYAELCRLCNGIGAEWMPKIMRNLLTALSPFAEPAAVIHDVEYFEGGAERERGMADLQFRDNIVITAKKVLPLVPSAAVSRDGAGRMFLSAVAAFRKSRLAGRGEGPCRASMNE